MLLNFLLIALPALPAVPAFFSLTWPSLCFSRPPSDFKCSFAEQIHYLIPVIPPTTSPFSEVERDLATLAAMVRVKQAR